MDVTRVHVVEDQDQDQNSLTRTHVEQLMS